jgi:hypothetical protein
MRIVTRRMIVVSLTMFPSPSVSGANFAPIADIGKGCERAERRVTAAADRQPLDRHCAMRGGDAPFRLQVVSRIAMYKKR